MKKIFTLILVSALGGAFTLGTYKLFIEEDESVAHQQIDTSPFTIPVNYKTVNTNLAAGEAIDFTTAAEKTVHSVVHVRNTTTSSGAMSFEDLFFGRRSQRPQVGMGSGVIISSDGMIITNNHVIDGAENITITLNNNKSYEAELIGTDPKTDIALLKIEADEELPYTTFGDSDNSKVGEWVLAVGNPFNLTSTVTAGIISAKSRDLSGGGNQAQSFIQTDAAVNPGNSGGALVNTNGDLIGINTAITSQTGSYVGYSFAVPSNIAKKVVEDIMEFGNVQNGILGVTGGSLNSASAKELGVDDTEGFYVSTVEEDSGAKKAGIKEGDIIKQLDNVKISKFSDLKGFLNTKSPNDVVYVTVLRDGNEKTLPVTLAKLSSVRVPIIGTLKEASKSDLKKMKVDYGLKITDLSGSYIDEWKADGVDNGSIVTAINGVKVNSIDDVNSVMSKYSEKIYKIEIVKNNGEKVNYRFR
ncbi:trypsin-like peptidase domain-containing protein [Flavobacteriaceae bacterium S0862]|nr:trypsin-like peptidase domain-containing protein [Flavobacteriaceae bacterium S0862]